jgi:DNA-binding transcriptional regulator YiaG
MIRNDTKYQETVRQVAESKKRVEAHRVQLESTGLSPEEIKRALDPLRSFYLHFEEEIEEYEQLKRGDLDELANLEGLGRTLVGLRIATGLTQRQLADRLGVHESQVSRDERNEYQGITVERASRVLAALGVTMRSMFKGPGVRAARTAPGEAFKIAGGGGAGRISSGRRGSRR